MNVRDVLRKHERAVAIVHYRAAMGNDIALYRGGHPPQNPAVLLQVSLLASKVSNSGLFIRLGDTQGDEIVGWTNIDALDVVEILGVLKNDGTTVAPIGAKDAVE